MVHADSPGTDQEPTPEFDEQCINVIRQWQRGETPFKEAVATITHLEQQAIQDGHLANQGRANHLLGYIQHFRGNLETSIQHYEKARGMFSRVGNARRVSAMDLNQGENYRYKGDFNRALRLYRTAYEISKEQQDLKVQTMASLNEGLVLMTVGQNTSAVKAFTQTLELTALWEDTDDRDLPSLLCEVQHGLAVTNLRQGSYDGAWAAALEALTIARRIGEPFQNGYANRIMGEVVTELDSIPDPAFSNDPDDYFRAAMDAFRELNAEAELARTMHMQALSLARRGRRTTAARKLQQVMIIFTRLGMVDDAARAAEAQLSVL
jgi:tetratricopeptide (TPR) repeat protein